MTATVLRHPLKRTDQAVDCKPLCAFVLGGVTGDFISGLLYGLCYTFVPRLFPLIRPTFRYCSFAEGSKTYPMLLRELSVTSTAADVFGPYLCPVGPLGLFNRKSPLFSLIRCHLSH